MYLVWGRCICGVFLFKMNTTHVVRHVVLLDRLGHLTDVPAQDHKDTFTQITNTSTRTHMHIAMCNRTRASFKDTCAYKHWHMFINKQEHVGAWHSCLKAPRQRFRHSFRGVLHLLTKQVGNMRSVLFLLSSLFAFFTAAQGSSLRTANPPIALSSANCKTMCQRFAMPMMGAEFSDIKTPQECCTKCDGLFPEGATSGDEDDA